MLIPVIPQNPRPAEGSFQIPIKLHHSCCKLVYDFDPNDYNPGLHPFVTREEFSQSIGNIRKAILKQVNMATIMQYIGGAIIFTGLVLFVVGGITAATSQVEGFPPLVGVGFGLCFLGIVLKSLTSRYYGTNLIFSIQQAVAAENNVYQNKSDKPSTWNFIYNRLNLNPQGVIISQSCIEIFIGRQTPNSNPNIPPPPYVLKLNDSEDQTITQPLPDNHSSHNNNGMGINMGIDGTIHDHIHDHTVIHIGSNIHDHNIHHDHHNLHMGIHTGIEPTILNIHSNGIEIDGIGGIHHHHDHVGMGM